MGEMNGFAFTKGNSILHRLDVRCKMICLCMMSVGLMKSGFVHLSIISLVVSTLGLCTGLSFWRTFREMKYFLVLLVFVFTARALSTPGSALIEFLGIPLTKEGVIEGGQVVWRFSLVMIMGMLFTFSTQPSSVKAGVEWFLKPIPFIPEKRAGMMVSLFIRFLPMILRQAKEISLAQKARCADLNKNPIKRIIMISMPLMKKVFQSADRLVIAMESRCYSEDRSDIPLTSSGNEMNFYTVTSLLLLFIIR